MTIAAKTSSSEKCPVCGTALSSSLGDHVRDVHDESILKELIFADKQSGIPDTAIGARYRISFNYLQKVITEKTGTNVSLLGAKKVRSWEPRNFVAETSTVWSFKSRGNWATHDGRYRGNWSPYIPRNVILRYSNPRDLVLDQFVGGGTTAVEAKLLGRRCIARDINPNAIDLTRTNINFDFPRKLGDNLRTFQPELSVGDARSLLGIANGSIDLICTHPPYAGIINYSDKLQGDLSGLAIPEFLASMRQVADECLRVLKPGGKCAVLIGDGRKEKHVIPIGFRTIRQFLDAGFILKELIIKRQHNCRTTGFWYNSSVRYNFLLLAHEYLPVFEKPRRRLTNGKKRVIHKTAPYRITEMTYPQVGEEALETTTVWLNGDIDTLIKRNVAARFGGASGNIQEVYFEKDKDGTARLSRGVVLIRTPDANSSLHGVKGAGYVHTLDELARQYAEIAEPGGAVVVETQDTRHSRKILPLALLALEEIGQRGVLRLKEIVVVAPSVVNESPLEDGLKIVHRYLLVLVK